MSGGRRRNVSPGESTANAKDKGKEPTCCSQRSWTAHTWQPGSSMTCVRAGQSLQHVRVDARYLPIACPPILNDASEAFQQALCVCDRLSVFAVAECQLAQHAARHASALCSVSRCVSCRSHGRRGSEEFVGG
eukprot:727714-Rhodomonas_salina.1